MNKFQHNLEESQRAEHAIVEMLKRAGRQAWLNAGDNKDCDVYLKGASGNIPIEVKADWLSLATGNVCIEPQTLEHTKAEFFIYLLPRPYILETSKLRALYSQYQKVEGGDQGKPLALVPREQFYLHTKELIKE
jgi:hypothetical protein